jgi:lysozyme family protein
MTTDETWRWAYHFCLYGDTPRRGEKLWAGEQGKSLPRASDVNPTLNGVTQATYDAFRDAQEAPRQPVFAMVDAEQGAIYRDGYWLPSGAGKLAAMDKPKLALCHFVTAVNTGRRPAIKMLQRAVRNETLQVAADGIIGPRTLDACLAADDHDAAVKYTGQLVRHYRAIAAARPDLAPNLKGWCLRVSAIQREIGLT